MQWDSHNHGNELEVLRNHQVSIGSDNGLSPIRRQAIVLSKAELLSIRHLVTNCTEILIKTQNFSLAQMHLKRPSAIWRPFFQGRLVNHYIRESFKGFTGCTVCGLEMDTYNHPWCKGELHLATRRHIYKQNMSRSYKRHTRVCTQQYGHLKGARKALLRTCVRFCWVQRRKHFIIHCSDMSFIESQISDQATLKLCEYLWGCTICIYITMKVYSGIWNQMSKSLSRYTITFCSMLTLTAYGPYNYISYLTNTSWSCNECCYRTRKNNEFKLERVVSIALWPLSMTVYLSPLSDNWSIIISTCAINDIF